MHRACDLSNCYVVGVRAPRIAMLLRGIVLALAGAAMPRAYQPRAAPGTTDDYHSAAFLRLHVGVIAADASDAV